jgi:hypothetical protein
MPLFHYHLITIFYVASLNYLFSHPIKLPEATCFDLISLPSRINCTNRDVYCLLML